MVPKRPVLIPADWRICLIIQVVVLLPLVPVTANIFILEEGQPYTSDASLPISRRTSLVISWGTGRGISLSVRRTQAPFSTAAAAKSSPSLFSPLTQQKTDPGTTSLLSPVTCSRRGWFKGRFRTAGEKPYFFSNSSRTVVKNGIPLPSPSAAGKKACLEHVLNYPAEYGGGNITAVVFSF